MWTSFQHMFILPVDVSEKILRAVIVYAALVILLRIFGKRELAQLNPFDLVVLLSLSNTVQNALIGEDNSLLGGLIGALALLGFNYLVVRYVFKHRRLDQLLGGTPTTLIEHGRVRHKHLAQELMSEAELVAVAHRQGYSGLEQVETCIMEPGGAFFMEGKKPEEQIQKQVLARLDEISRQIAGLREK